MGQSYCERGMKIDFPPTAITSHRQLPWAERLGSLLPLPITRDHLQHVLDMIIGLEDELECWCSGNQDQCDAWVLLRALRIEMGQKLRVSTIIAPNLRFPNDLRPEALPDIIHWTFGRY